ncbi:MAG: uncharacterized protein QOE90_412 [Thermoplasmata archaeon]|jgi:RPA family protein|nr:uncharacterized protein [Thermoplasmata archaeon]
MSAPVPGAEGEAGDARFQREVAHRVFAAEFNQSKFSYKESGDRSPTFVVSPYGAKVNRLFLVGVLTSVETSGATGTNYRGQIVDPTGLVTIWAGQYEPEAMAQLAEIHPPAVVAVVGKGRTREPEPGVTYVSIRPESIHQVDKADRDAWILDTARQSLQRLDAMREAQKMETPTPKALEDLGFPQDVAEGVCKAIEHYGKADLARYAALVRDALESLLPGGAEKMAAVPEFAPAAPRSGAAPPPQRQPSPQPVPQPKAPEANAHEDAVLALCEKLDDGKGAPWEDVVAEAAKKGIGEAAVEECLNALMDKGQIYEPVLGRLKRT